MAVPVIELRSDPKQLKRLLDVVAEDQQEFLVNYARRVIREEIRNGFPVEFRTRVDSVLDRRVQDVRPFGRIEYINMDSSGYKLYLVTSKDTSKWIKEKFLKKVTNNA